MTLDKMTAAELAHELNKHFVARHCENPYGPRDFTAYEAVISSLRKEARIEEQHGL